MRIILLAFLLLFLSSCGTRKVDLHKTSTIEEKETHLQEQTEIKEIQWNRKKVFEIMKQLNIRGGEITIQPDGTIHAKGEEIDWHSKEAGEKIENLQQKEENKTRSLDEAIKKAKEEKNKRIERKQYNWWLGLPLLLIIVTLIILLTSKKWRSKLKSIFLKIGTN